VPTHYLKLLTLCAIATYGLLIGSFLNAWIWRIRHNLKISRGRSICPKCKTQLRWYELIPVISFIGLRGKCRTCHKKISPQYPLVELVTALSWVTIYLFIYPTSVYSIALAGVWLIITTLMIASCVYDAKWMELPDQFTLPAIVVALIWLLVRWIGYGESSQAITQLISAGLFGGFFYLLWLGSGGAWLGDGDIRLAILMGLLLNSSQLVIAIFASYALGALVGIVLIMLKIKSRKDAIAFGPFLIVGLYIGFIWGEWLINLYFKLLG